MKREALKEMKELLKMDDLDQVSGGNGAGNNGSLHWTPGTVHGLVDYGPGIDSRLLLRDSPDGSVLNGYGWQNGDEIYVSPDTEKAPGSWRRPPTDNGAG